MINNRDDTDAQNEMMKDDLERLKEHNHIMEEEVQEQEVEKQKTGARLTKAVTHRKTLSVESEHLNIDCIEKDRQMNGLMHERQLIIEKLNSVNSELDVLTREEHHLHHSSLDLET